jgi:hypothetical protein
MSASAFPSYAVAWSVSAAAVAVPSLSSDSTTAAHCAMYTSDLICSDASIRWLFSCKGLAHSKAWRRCVFSRC